MNASLECLRTAIPEGQQGCWADITESDTTPVDYQGQQLKGCLRCLREATEALDLEKNGLLVENQHLKEENDKDPLTEIANIKAFEKKYNELVEKGVPFALITLDYRAFKSLNDAEGEMRGNDLLKACAACLKGERSDDLTGYLSSSELQELLDSNEVTPSRVGGDEFAILIDLTSTQNRHDYEEKRIFASDEKRVENFIDIVAQRLENHKIIKQYIKPSTDKKKGFGIYIGAAIREENETFEQTYNRADAKLNTRYETK